MGKHEKLTGRERAARYRAAQRAKGLRLKQFWVPDVRSAEFIAEARRQSLLIASSAQNAEDIAFAEALQYWPEDDPD